MDAADFFYNPITVMPNGPNRFSRALSPASLLLLIKEEEEKNLFFYRKGKFDTETSRCHYSPMMGNATVHTHTTQKLSSYFISSAFIFPPDVVFDLT